ncbi:DJ-1/PfpI family protein [Arenibaculum pallidiluteum]|uniref:DJ-1/PfpI family protein n=1 Tax=Arenibaculum pallidiluteum TaxID=2812559 RepID=UPI001A973E6C|nr:DJ-1/PfpI family protein [Arenibaculum pallidiluteum]
MDQPLAGKTIAILVANGFEEIEMTEPQRALLKAGATVRVISPEQGLVNGWHGAAWGHYFPVDRGIAEVLGADFDMLVLPGGTRSVAKLSQNPHTKRILSGFMDGGKPVAAIGDGVELLVHVQKAKGRTVAAPEAARAALTEAGATISEDAVVTDKVLVTAVGQDAVGSFVETLLKVFGEAAQVKKAA